MKKFSIIILITILLFSISIKAYSGNQNYKCIKKWGETGNGNGKFNMPWGIGIDPSGNIYVTDHKNNRIQKFNSAGTFLKKFGRKGFYGNGEFSGPMGIAIDKDGNVYIPSGFYPRIQVFSSSGNFLRKWGSQGTENGKLATPWTIGINSEGFVYVSDIGNQNISKFDSTGKFILKWGAQGNGKGQFSNPAGIAIDKDDNVYVTDVGNNRIQKFTSDGKFIMKFGKKGSGNGEFNGPWGIATDSEDRIYVTDHKNNRIQIFNSSGKFLRKWGKSGKDDDEFDSPKGIAVDKNGYVYVADSNNNRIQKFALVEYVPDENVEDVNSLQNQLAYWSFDDGTAKDLIGRHNGIIHGATKTEGKFGYGLRFNGQNNYVEIPFNKELDFKKKSATICAWIKLEGEPKQYAHRIIRIGEQITFGVESKSLKLGGYIYTYDWQGDWTETNYSLKYNEWYHVVMRWNGKDRSYFVNGSLVKSVPQSGLINGPAGKITIGMCVHESPGYDYPFKGIIDEVRIFNRALWEKEIESLAEGK